jgi:hypothetical protein
MVGSISWLWGKYKLRKIVDSKSNVYMGDVFDLVKSVSVSTKLQRFPYVGGNLYMAPKTEILFTASKPVFIKYTSNVYNDGRGKSAEHLTDYNEKQSSSSFSDDRSVNGVIDVDRLPGALHSVTII